MSPTSSNDASTYVNAHSGIRLVVKDDGSNLQFRYIDDVPEWHDADGRVERGVRCGYVARIVACYVPDHREGVAVPTSDGGTVVASKSADDNWRFVYRSQHATVSDCSYTTWSAQRGVSEFGVSTCDGVIDSRAKWTLQDRRGFFVKTKNRP